MTSSSEWQITLRATSAAPPSIPVRPSTTDLNCSRFSPRWIASIEAPISSTP
jgi:hypothetical protein